METVPSHASFPSEGKVFSWPATDIDTSGAWLFWSAEPSAALRRSLELQGQLSPVLVDASGPKPVLVAGAGRVAALADAGREAVCLDLGALDGRARALAYMHSNVGRELGDALVVAALRYFAALPPADMAPVLECLGLEPRSKRMRLLSSWLKLPLRWDGLLAAGAVPLACADLLECFPADGLEALEPVFAGLSWSRGNAVNLLTWIREICARDGVGAGDVLADCELREILAAGLSPKDAMSRITQVVRSRRLPVLSALESGFAEAARRIGAGTRWRIVQPDQFESGAVELGVRLTCAGDFRVVAEELARIAGREDLGALFPLGEK